MYDITLNILNYSGDIEHGETIVLITSAVLTIIFIRIIFKFIYKILEH